MQPTYARDEDGDLWELDAQGAPIRMVTEAPSAPSLVAPNPVRLARESQDRARQEASDARAERAEARQQATADRQAREWAAAHNPDGSPKLPPKTSKQLPVNAANDLEKAVEAFRSLNRAVNGFQNDYGGNTITGGLENTAQRLLGTGTPGQAQWWADFAATDNVLRNALFGASLTEGEKAAYEATSIKPNMAPSEIRANLNRRMELAQGKLTRRTAYLKANGYDPDAVDALVGTEEGLAATEQKADNELPGQDNGAAPKPPSPGEIQAVTGDTKTTTDPEVSALLDSMINAGAGAATINAALSKRGFQPVRDDELKAAQAWMKGNPGKKYFGGNATRTEDLSLGQQVLANEYVAPMAAGLANYFDAATAGTASALAGEEGQGNLKAATALNPGWAAGGNLLGAVTGAMGAEAAIGGRLAAAGVQNAAKWAPRLGDTLFGAATGFNNAQDGEGLQGALTGAGVGLLGGAAGRAAIRGVGGAARGVQNANAGYLQSQGIPVTVGGVMGGGVKKIEDALTGTPFLGSVVQGRQREGIEAVANRMAGDAVEPIGGTVAAVEYGEPMVEDLLRQGSDAYTAATAGARVPFDQQFAPDMAAVRAQGAMLPDDLQARFAKAIDNRVGPVEQAGELTGDTFQQAVRGLKSYRAEATKPGFEQDYRNALSGGIDALRGQMVRGGGQNVVEQLGQADEAWKRIKIIQDAVKAARNGSRSGEVGLPMPSQFNDAAYKTAGKFGGPRFNGELLDAAQQVLPSKLADSGTWTRALVGGGAIGLPTALGGGVGASEGGLGGASAGGLAGGLGGMLLLAAGGSKPAQKMLVNALTKRPDAFRVAGDRLVGNAAMGGRIGAGLGASVLTPLLVGP